MSRTSGRAVFYGIGVMKVMRIPKLGGIFDNGSNVSGQYKNIKLIILTRKNFEKLLTFSVSDICHIHALLMET